MLCNFLFAGTGDPKYSSKMQELVGELNLEDHVFFIGHVGGNLKVSLYQACDLFALESFSATEAASTAPITPNAIETRRFTRL